MKRSGQRLFIALTVFAMVVQSIPDQSRTSDTVPGGETRSLGENGFLGHRVQSCLDCIGLWQRPWTLFAPEPRMDCGWLSADVIANDGSSTRWTSPFWSEMSVYDRFVGSRSLNYYGRFSEPLIQSVSDDLADYIATNESPDDSTDHSTHRVELSFSSFKTLPNEDTLFPSRDETTSMLVTTPLTVREYPTSSRK